MSGGNPYNGYSWKERDEKFKEMQRRIAAGRLNVPTGPCAICWEKEGKFEYHDEDYSQPYSWSEPAAYQLCRQCHIHRLHQRFARPESWQAFIAHVRRGGTARDLTDPTIQKEFEAYLRAVRTGAHFELRQLRPYLGKPGGEWFALLRLDRESLTDPNARQRLKGV